MWSKHGLSQEIFPVIYLGALSIFCCAYKACEVFLYLMEVHRFLIQWNIFANKSTAG